MNTQNVEESNEKPANGTVDVEHQDPMEVDLADEADVSTNITDLDNDCLEYIFKKLELKDLLSVADASKCFKVAVDMAYTSEYGKMQVFISTYRRK